MEFLGAQSVELQKMKSQLVSQDALLRALLHILTPEQQAALSMAFSRCAEEAKSNMLNTLASDALYGRLLESLDQYAQMVATSTTSNATSSTATA